MINPFRLGHRGDFGIGSRIAREEAAGAKRAARRAQSEASEVDDRLERLAMTCEALWTILRDKLGVTEEELLNRITEIDLSNGALDGKAKKVSVSCPKCGRTIARRFPNCMYCGQPVMHDAFS